MRVMWDVFDDCIERIGTLWIDGFVCGDCVMIKFRDNIFCCFRVCVCSCASPKAEPDDEESGHVGKHWREEYTATEVDQCVCLVCSCARKREETKDKIFCVCELDDKGSDHVGSA